MALSIDLSKTTIEVIAFKDPSVRCDRDVYDEYLKTLDEALLDLDAESTPTRFVFRKNLPYKLSQKLQNEMFAFADGKAEYKIGSMMDAVRFALVDVKNPGSDSLAFKKDNVGLASEDLVATLYSAGILADLYFAHTNATGMNSVDKAKKN